MIVVAALIHKDNKILIAQRKTGNEEVLGKWEFPGGKVEIGETDQEAIEREINEEFDIVIRANNYLTHAISNDIDLKLYDCEYIEGKINLHDHYSYKWINITELLNFDLAYLDVELAKEVLNYFKY